MLERSFEIKKNKDKNIDSIRSMFACRSFVEYTKNMYLMTNPFDIDIRVEKSKVLNLGNRNLDSLFLLHVYKFAFITNKYLS